MKSPSLYFLFFVITLNSSAVFAQQRLKVQQVKGEWEISNDITPIQARENAINQAKTEALRQAGVPEAISASNVLYHSGDPNRMKELFESLTTVDISGELSEVTITKEEKKLNEQGNIMYRVWIDATVIIHKDPKDPSFGMEIKGVRESYGSPDRLTFEVQPWKDGYLTVFILSDKEGIQLFPNKLERQEKLLAQKKYPFPISIGLDYEVSTERETEVNYLVLLYTKEEIPFMKEQTRENILFYISAITPPHKFLKTYSLLIKK